MKHECYARTTRYLLPCSDTHFSGRGAGAFANYENLCFFSATYIHLVYNFLFRVSVRVLGGSHEGWFWTLTSGILESHFQRRLGRGGGDLLMIFYVWWGDGGQTTTTSCFA